MTNYPIRIHTDTSAAEATNHRLAVIRWKTPSDKKDDASYKKPATLCVSIPRVAIKLSEDQQVLANSLQDAFEEMQDAVIRSVMDNYRENNTPISEQHVSEDAISFTAVAAFNQKQAVSGKLSKELISGWFDASLKEQLETAIAQLPGMDDTKLAAAVQQHKSIICSLASPRVNLPIKVATSITKAVNLAADSKVKDSLLNKLELLSKPQDTLLETLL